MELSCAITEGFRLVLAATTLQASTIVIHVCSLCVPRVLRTNSCRMLLSSREVVSQESNGVEKRVYEHGHLRNSSYLLILNKL